MACAIVTNWGNIIKWTTPDQNDISHVEVYRREDDDTASITTADIVAKIPNIANTEQAFPFFYDLFTAIHTTTQYWYWLKSVAYDGQRSNGAAPNPHVTITADRSSMYGLPEGNVTNEPSGFPNRTDSVLSWDDVTRTLSISPSGTSFDYYIKSQKFTVTAADTIVPTNTTGTTLFYYNSATLTEINSPSDADIETLILEKALVAVLYWNTAQATKILFGDERHGITMDGMTHHYLHDVNGLAYEDGLALVNFTADQTGADNEDAQFGHTAGKVYDEDINHTAAAVLSTTGLPIWYRLGSGGPWVSTTNAGYSIITAAAGTRLVWNENVAGTWQLTEVNNVQFVLCHVFATNDMDNPLIAIVGQADYATLAAAQTGATTEINSLLLGDLPGPEMRPIGTVIFQTGNAYGNQVNARVRAVAGGGDYIDWRTATIAGSGVAVSDHGSLSGLADDDHTQYVINNGTRGAQSVCANLTLGGDLAVCGALTVSSTVTLGDTLSVSGISSFNNNVGISGILTVTTLNVTGSASVQNTLHVSGAATFGSTVDISGATTINNSLSVSGVATFSTLNVTANASVGGTLHVCGAVTFGSTLTVSGDVSINANFAVTGTATIDGATIINDTLTVSGITTVFGLVVTGGATINDGLNVSGATTLGSTTVCGTLTVSGTTTLHGAVTMSGGATISNLTVTGDITMCGTLTVNGTAITNATGYNIYITESATSHLDTTTDDVYLNFSNEDFNVGINGRCATITLAGAAGYSVFIEEGAVNKVDTDGQDAYLNFDGNDFDVTVGTGESATVTLASGLALDGGLTVNGGITVSGALTVSGNISLNGTLTVSGISTLQGAVTISGGLTTNTLAVTGNATVCGTLTVDGNTTIDADLIVSGSSTLQGAVTISGGLTVNTLIVTNTLTVCGTTTLGGATVVDNTLTVSGISTLQGAVTMSGGATISNLTITGDLTMCGTLTVNGTAITNVNADDIKCSHIDWGDGADQVTSFQMPLGSATDSDWTDGILSWTNTTNVADALDELNETLSYLAPADAGELTGPLTSSGTVKYTGYLAQGATNYAAADPAGTLVTYIIDDPDFTLSSADTATSFNKADEGETRWYKAVGAAAYGAAEDAVLHTANFTEGERAGTQSSTPWVTGALKVDNVAWYNSFPKWQIGRCTVTVDVTDVSRGYNRFKFTRECGFTTQSSDDFEIFYDDGIVTPTLGTISASENTPVIRRLSGVRFYDRGSTFNINMDCANGTISYSYNSTRLLAIASTPTGTMGTVGNKTYNSAGIENYGTSPPTYAGVIGITALTTTVPASNVYSTNARIQVTAYNVKNGTAVGYSANENRLINGYTTTSGALDEYFDDEDRRISADADFTDDTLTLTGVWCSDKTLVDGEAQVISGSLTYPSQNFNAGYLPTGQSADYSAFSGDQVYYRAMYDSTGTPHSSGTIKLGGLVNADVGAAGAGAVNVFIQLPGECPAAGGWLDLGTAFSAPFAGNDGDGIKVTQSGDEWNWSVGTFSTSNSGDRYYIKIVLRNGTRDITSVQETGW